MPAKQTVDKQAMAHALKAYKISDTQYFVESSKENILYKVTRINGNFICTCGHYSANAKKDEAYRCKHILAALNGNVQNLGRHNGKPRLNEQFIINMKGNDFVKYAGLLDLAHQKGIQAMKVKPIQFPTRDNNFEAICEAVLEAPNGEIFTEIGDANPKNVNNMVSKHILRMAATRAKARCLRDFVNVGMTCLDELGGDDIIEPEGKPGKPSSQQSAKPAKPAGEVIPMKQKESSQPKQADSSNQQTQEQSGTKQTATNNKTSKDGPKPSQAQKHAIESLAHRRGLNMDDLDRLCQNTLGVAYEYLSASDAAVFIKTLQQSG